MPQHPSSCSSREGSGQWCRVVLPHLTHSVNAGPERRLEINLPSRSSGSSSRSVQSPALATESGEVWYVYVPMRRGELSTSFIATARGFRQAAGAFLPHGPLVARPDASASQNVCRQGALYLHSCLFSVCQLPAGLPVSFSKHARVPAVVKWSALETCSECSTQYNSSSSKARPPKIRASMKACWCFLVRPEAMQCAHGCSQDLIPTPDA